MKIKAVLFDLDGTLLPMDQDAFVKGYFGGLARKLAPLGYEPEKLIESIQIGSAAIYKNDGSKTNEEAFWSKFSEIYGEDVVKDIPVFERFYEEDFDKIRQICGHNPDAARCVGYIKELGLRMTLATNPLFPSIATEKRAKWAGLNIEDFEIYTTYENSRYCKPNIKYYEDILLAMKLKPEEAIMVGNDVSEDMVAGSLGMKVFLMTDCLINKKNEDISKYPHGSFEELIKYIESLV